MFENEFKGKVVLVTGGSRGIGFAAVKGFLAGGAKVYFLSHYEETGAKALAALKEINPDYEVMTKAIDLCDYKAVQDLYKEIIAKWGRLDVLVNNAGSAYYGLHEELSPKKIQEMVRTDLEVPMILSQQLLRGFKKNKGCIVNIASVTAQQSNPHGCAYGAVKAGLASFSRSLFDEARKYGVRVAVVSPDMTKTELYRNADFTVGEETESYLLPQDVADAVAYIVGQREGVAVSEVTLRPQYHRIRRKPVTKKERPVE